MQLTAIAAISKNGGLGHQGALLFHLPEDMEQFRRLTLGGTLIMGRKTLESLPQGRPLPQRSHVVLSRNPDYTAPGVQVAHSVQELAELLPKLPLPHMVAGGEEIYRLLMPHCTALELTMVDTIARADCYFPLPTAQDGWHCVRQSPKREHFGLFYSFSRWERDTGSSQEGAVSTP